MRHLMAAFVAGWIGVCAISLGDSFSNATPMTIPSGGNASPYPSPVTVTGLGPVTTLVSVTLQNFSHTFPDDVGVVLVGPTGAALLLQDGAGDDPDMIGVTYMLADAAATFLPDVTAWPAGTYKPTAYYTGDSFPAPGPLVAYNSPAIAGAATFASTFNGLDPNGTWNLFVEDFVDGDGGAFAGGWTLDITATPEPSSLVLLAAAPVVVPRRRRR